MKKKRKTGCCQLSQQHRLIRVWVGIVNMFCDYIFYFDLSLEGGNNDGSYLHNMWGKKTPSYELSVCLWCFESQRGVFGVIVIFFLSFPKQNKTKQKKSKKKTRPPDEHFLSLSLFHNTLSTLRQEYNKLHKWGG